MQLFNEKYKEELFELEFNGKFEFEELRPTWFAENNYFSKDEADKFRTYTSDKEIRFNNNILYFEINHDTFKMYCFGIGFYPILQDAFVRIVPVFKPFMSRKYLFKLKLHQKFAKKSEITKILDQFAPNPNIESLNEIKAASLTYSDFKTQKHYNLTRKYSIFPCQRNHEDFKHNLHIFITNEVEFNSNKWLNYLNSEQLKISNRTFQIANMFTQKFKQIING